MSLVVLWTSSCRTSSCLPHPVSAAAPASAPRYVTVPLDLTTPEAIAVLAGTITMTPGTVSADLSADGRALLVHCLDRTNPAATRRCDQVPLRKPAEEDLRMIAAAVTVALVATCLAIVLTLYRLVVGPDATDRGARPRTLVIETIASSCWPASPMARRCISRAPAPCHGRLRHQPWPSAVPAARQ